MPDLACGGADLLTDAADQDDAPTICLCILRMLNCRVGRLPFGCVMKCVTTTSRCSESERPAPARAVLGLGSVRLGPSCEAISSIGSPWCGC